MIFKCLTFLYPFSSVIFKRSIIIPTYSYIFLRHVLILKSANSRPLKSQTIFLFCSGKHKSEQSTHFTFFSVPSSCPTLIGCPNSPPSTLAGSTPPSENQVFFPSSHKELHCYKQKKRNSTTFLQQSYIYTLIWSHTHIHGPSWTNATADTYFLLSCSFIPISKISKFVPAF